MVFYIIFYSFSYKLSSQTDVKFDRGHLFECVDGNILDWQAELGKACYFTFKRTAVPVDISLAH